eukprot:UN01611
MPLPNEEAGAAANPVPLSDSITAQPNAVTTNINEESLRNAASVQHNEEARTVNQKPPSSASLQQPKEPRVENGELFLKTRTKLWEMHLVRQIGPTKMCQKSAQIIHLLLQVWNDMCCLNQMQWPSSFTS